jgi:hypothetical protein
VELYVEAEVETRTPGEHRKELCLDELDLQVWRPNEGSGCGRRRGETMEARRADLGDEVGEARRKERGRDPLGMVEKEFYLDIPWKHRSRRRGC